MNDSSQRRFFDDHQWATIEAASARIIPTDADPGAREAGVVRFIDRYLSGIDYIYANADGSGFIQLTGKSADAWHARISALQARYEQGIRELDEISRQQFGTDFVALTEEQQDDVLVAVSRAPRPERVRARRTHDAVVSGVSSSAEHAQHLPTQPSGTDAIPFMINPLTDDGLDFFRTLVLHTRAGFYADPVYGGNKDHIGWRVIGFAGPNSLADTSAGRFSTAGYMLMDAEWPYGLNLKR